MRLTYKKLIFLVLSIGLLVQLWPISAEENISMLDKKPVFFINVKSVDIGVQVSVNGMFAYSDQSHRGQAELDVPVNHYMHSFDNTLTVEVFPPKKGGEFKALAMVKVELRVRDFGKFDTSYKIADISFDSGSELKNNKGHYRISSGEDFVESDDGDVVVGEIGVSGSDEYPGTVVASRKIVVPNSLPKWAFFRSDTIPNYYDFEAVSDEEYQKDLEELLVEYKKVHSALESGDIDSVMPLFYERNRETDLAFYRNPGETEQAIRDSLESSANDSNLELVGLKADYVALHPEPNGKVTSLKRDSMKSPVVLNFKEGEGSVHYPMYFRKEDGKWILTR